MGKYIKGILGVGKNIEINVYMCEYIKITYLYHYLIECGFTINILAGNFLLIIMKALWPQNKTQ